MRFVVEAANVRRSYFYVWFFIKATTLKEDDSCMIRHQIHNYRKNVLRVVRAKAAIAKEEAPSVVRHQS